jgi:hypothetical protein
MVGWPVWAIGERLTDGPGRNPISFAERGEYCD